MQRTPKYLLGLMALSLVCSHVVWAAPAKEKTPTKQVTPAKKKAPAKAAKVKATPTAKPTPDKGPQVEVDFDSPTRVIQRYTDQLTNIVEPTKKAVKGKRDTKREKRIVEKVRQFFDFQRLARLSLGHHWSKVSKAKRKEFSDLFIGLVEDSYLRRSRDLVGNYEITYGREEINGNQASVVTSVGQKDVDVEITYQLHRRPKNWMIYNIVLDGVDLVRNYQSQFNRIIGKSSFNELLKKMRKKLHATDEEEVTL